MNDEVRRLRRTFLIGTFLRWFGPGLTVPVLILVLTDGGLDLAGVGVVFAVYGATTATMELPTGGLADAVGRRPVLVTAAVLFVVFDVILLLGNSLNVYVAGAIVGGVGRALSSGPLEAWFIDRARTVDPELQLRPDLSRAGVVGGMALGIGALSSAAITTLAEGTQVAGISLVALPVAVAAVADVIFAATMALLLVEPDPPSDRSSPRALTAALREVPRVVTDGLALAGSEMMLRRLLAAALVVAVGAVTIELLWQPRLAELVGGTAQAAQVAGLVVAGFMFAQAVGSALAQRLPHTLAHRPGPVAGALLLLASASMLGLAASQTARLLAVALLVFYCLLAASDVLRNELLHEWVPSSRRATMVSVRSLAAQLGNVVASLLVARIAGATSIPVGWIIGAAAVAIGAAVMAATNLPASACARPADEPRQSPDSRVDSSPRT